jgi:tetratricopeptide (TPR) repeat protein
LEKVVARGKGKLKSEASLHLAGLLIHCFGDADSGIKYLKSIDTKKLDKGQRRLAVIYYGDAALTKGEIAKARAKYYEAGTVVEKGDLHYAARRRSRLESAKDFIRRKEFDAAEENIRNIEWETPVDRLGTETGLALISIYKGRKEFDFARQHCHRMLKVAPMGRARAKILYTLAEVDFALGLEDEARSAVNKLLKEHPYSEAAAFAKDRF